MNAASRSGTSGTRRRHHLARSRAYGDAGGHTKEDQKRRQDEAAADAEHAREHADGEPHAEQHVRIERKLGDGKIDLHRPYGTRALLR